MSQVKIQGDVNGTGIFTIAAPNSNSNSTLTLPTTGGALFVNPNGALNLNAATPANSVNTDSAGNLLVGTQTNTNGSKIVSNGVIESTTGGVRFPDGTTQTTAAGALTTAAVTTAYAGASALGVGTYVIARPANTTSYSSGTTLAGSSLFMCPPQSHVNNSNQFVVTGLNVLTSTTNLSSGTWRCMSTAFVVTDYASMPGLWMRIS